MKKIVFILVFALIASSVSFAQKGKGMANKAKVGTNIGDKAPELVYNSPNGRKIALSSLKGKMVLIDFWASWCGPCRRENPNVVANYNKYKNMKFKGGKKFTVYSVSLDNNASSWTKAIAKDNLSWTNHVSDLGGWGSKGPAIYGVTGIPMNYLINGKGIIVGKNLRGNALGSALASLVKSDGDDDDHDENGDDDDHGKGKKKANGGTKKGKSSNH